MSNTNSNNLTIFFVSLGCDKNLVDSEVMLGILRAHGFTLVDDEIEADIIVVNTCSFIHDAKEESIQTILEMAEMKHSCRCKALIVTGCMAERYKDEIMTEIEEVDAVIGTTSYQHIAEVVAEVLEGQKVKQFDDLQAMPEVDVQRIMTTGGYSSYLKIAEGCDKHCTYCIIPSLRGKFRSRPVEGRVALGARSAVFAPLQNLGLIILDEEQETSYQSENPPRYHARDVAQFRCAQNDALLLLGSATPTIETAYAAKNSRYQVFSLHKRFNDLPLPKVLIADMKDELRQGNETSIGHALRAELEKNIECGEQSILFLNRRGSARMLLCGECGYVPQCPRCSVPMTYHSANERLMCHYCGHSEAVVDRCSECGGLMKRVGSGTQKVEQELFDLFPKAKVLRMDADTVGASRGHEALLREFEEKKIPILLGTQMVAKGLDFENVTLVGVLDADLSLYAQNYHAAERTYSLLAQVVGRAGRGERPGRAVIQTYHPENEVIQAAAKQDYKTFYQNELRMRSLRRYPPFADLFTLTVSGLDELRVIAAARALCDALRYASSQPPLSGLDVEVLGPAGAPVVKVNNRYRYCVYLCGKGGSVLRRTVSEYLLAFYARKENRGLDIFADCNALQ